MQNSSVSKLFVAWQDEESREWIPVAMLTYDGSQYRLRYTHGVKRCRNFSGLGRMIALEKEYVSDSLFPFFANRMVSKSRPEYGDYIRWLGLDDLSGDPMTVMAVTGGLRATDSFELIAVPKRQGQSFEVDFFVRGIRYFPPVTRDLIDALPQGEGLYLLRDIQNDSDVQSLLLRTKDPKVLVGYVPKYYCAGLNNLLDKNPEEVCIKVKQVNRDAPLDMRVLCTLVATCKADFQLFENERDFLPLILDEALVASRDNEGAMTLDIDID